MVEGVVGGVVGGVGEGVGEGVGFRRLCCNGSSKRLRSPRNFAKKEEKRNSAVTGHPGIEPAASALRTIDNRLAR